jgi:hypothetical protein
MRRLFSAVLILLCASSCSSDDDFTPTTPSGPSIPSIGGTYSSNNMWRFDLTSAGGPNLIECAGGLTVTTQVGTSFSGTFFIADPRCGNFGGTVVNGVLNETAVSFELTVSGADTNFMTSAFGCTFVSGDRLLTGTLISNQLAAEARIVMNCPNDGVVNLHLRLAGTK